MKFFVIDSAPVQTSLFKDLNARFPVNPKVYRVDGVKTNEVWLYDGNVPAFAGLDWLIDADTLDPYNYMMVSNMAWPMMKIIPNFKVDGVDNVTPFDFICEFKI